MNDLMARKLGHAACNGCLNEVRRLLEREKVSPNSQNSWGETALHQACHFGNFHIVRYLVEDAKADANKTDGRGATALHAACSRPRSGFPIVQYLVEKAGLSVHATDQSLRTALHFACFYKGVGLETISYLVENQKADLRAKDKSGSTPLYLAFKMNGQLEVIRYLIAKEESIEKRVLQLALSTNRWEWEIKEKVLELYAAEHGISDRYAKFPIHTVFTFPLQTYNAFVECVQSFHSTTLFLMDSEGRLPLHVALSIDSPVRSPSLVSLLLERDPSSALRRDPKTGSFPYERAVMMPGDDWLTLVYEMFRMDPERFLRARGLVEDLDAMS